MSHCHAWGIYEVIRNHPSLNIPHSSMQTYVSECTLLEDTKWGYQRMEFWLHIHYRKGSLQNNLSLLLSEDTSLLRALLASTASFSSFWSLRRAAVARWDSSSLSSTCIFSCLARRFAFSAYNMDGISQSYQCHEENMGPQMLYMNPSYLVLILLHLFSFILYLIHQFL